jgi:hypothetical protein
MRNVDILIGERVVVKVRRKKFLIGSPISVSFANKGKEIGFYYNIDNIPSNIESKLREFVKYIKSVGDISSKEPIYTPTNKDLFSIQIPKNYRFRIRNV